jgi:zinc transporter
MHDPNDLPPSAAFDARGLICAFELTPLKPRGPELLAEHECSPVWLHFNLTDTRACQWIEQQADIPDAARELLLEPDARIRSIAVPDGFAVVLGDLHHDYRGDPEDFGVLRIHVDSRRIITARMHPLKSTDRLRHDLLRSEVEPGSPYDVFEHLLGCLAETLAAVVAALGNDTDDTEEEILAERYQHQGRTLGKMRRLLARLRRQIAANRAALGLIANRLPQPCSAEQRQALRAAIELFDGVAQDLELVQERARLLQEELAGRVGEATNRNLFLLSIVTTTLLPITLITGVFGMNVGGLPWVSDSGGFWWVVLLMVASVVTVLLILRRRSVL